MIIIFNNGTSSVTVQSVTHSMALGGGEQNLGGEVLNYEEVPIMRHSNAKNGSCVVEVNDGGTYTKTLAELLALHSSTGEGDYDIMIDGVLYAERGLVTVSTLGKLGQHVKIDWKGSDG